MDGVEGGKWDYTPYPQNSKEKGKSTPKFMVDYPDGTSKDVDQVISIQLLIKKLKAGISYSITYG